MAGLQHVRKGLRSSQQHDRRNHEGHGRDELAGDEQEPVDGRSPVRRERHHPVDGRETHGEYIKDDSGSGQHFQPAAQGAILPVGVLLLGQTVKDEHQGQPHRKIDEGAHEIAIMGEIALLEF